jgi:hypothetical protein
MFCAAHGGGKRCKVAGCGKCAVGVSLLCTSHGGGRRCEHDGCTKSAQSSTPFCVRHGVSVRCCPFNIVAHFLVSNSERAKHWTIGGAKVRCGWMP